MRVKRDGEAVDGQMHLAWEGVQAGNVTGIIAGRKGKGQEGAGEL